VKVDKEVREAEEVKKVVKERPVKEAEVRKEGYS
jgi:hypothetical protein